MNREEALKYAKFRLECYSKGDGEYTEHGKFLIAAIKALQEPEPKKGQWIEGKTLEKCSICGKKGFPDWRYCPNCGADMRGKKDE